MTNANVPFFDNEELIQLVFVMGQDEGKPFNLQLKGRISPKPKEDNAGDLSPRNKSTGNEGSPIRSMS